MATAGEPLRVAFAMTDALMAAAIREYAIALGREWFRPRTLAVVAASAAMGVVGLQRDGAWLAWLAIVPPVLFVALFAGWLGAWWWLPRSGVRRLAHLPHRDVRVEFGDDALAFVTATERLAVAWSEVAQIRRLDSFWLFCLRAGARIPVPAALLADSAVTALRARTAGPAARPQAAAADR